MSEDFRAKVTAELDTAAAESKLEEFLNKNNKLKIDVELNQDSAKKMTSSIEKGLKQTKLDTSSLSKQLAGSFNITDKSTINQIKSQLNGMLSSLSKAWDGLDFNSKSKGMLDFAAGMEPLQKTLAQNAKMIEGSTGIYDEFYNYFKDKQIYISDELKNALGNDTYKELLQNNIGKIVRDAGKGIDISSIWGEMQSLFPEHFSENITTQADQVIHAFDLMKKARAEMAQQMIPYQNMDSQTKAVVDETAWQQVSAASGMLMGNLKNNIQSAAEAAKTTIDLDVNVNTEKITSDLRNAVQSAATGTGEAMNLDLKMNEEQIVSSFRTALSQIATGEEPVKVDIQINKESLKSDLSAALSEMDLPVKFKIDAAELEKQIRAALEKIKDVKMDLHINTDALKQSVGESVTESVNQAEAQTATVRTPTVDTSNMAQFQQLMGNINTAGRQGKSVFESLGNTFKQAFSVYSGAYLLQDGINKVIQSGKKAVSTVKEFNDIKTDLAMATGENKTYINDLMQDYNALGQELGAITSDVALSADTWLRQGRSMSDTSQLIKDSMVLSKDAQMDSEQAAEVLTATLNGFQMNADQAGHINDVLNSIDLKSASDAGGIGQALTKVASQANNAGVSLEKTAAMIATIKDVTQDSDDSIGTGLKSIFSRMNQIKAGKFVDSETGESLNDVEKVLKKVGISMRDVNGQFKESEPVIDEVAQKWSTFDGNTKKAVATAMAGTYQYNKLIAMFDNWNKVQMLTETAQNSDGTAQQKFEDNYLTSLEAKTNALKSSLENVATGLISDNMYAGFLDGAKAVADFTAQTDLLKASLAGLGAAGGVFAFQQLISLFKELSNFGSALNISKIADMSTDSFAQLLALTQNLTDAQTKLVLSSTNLSNAQRMAVLMNQGMSEAQASAAIASMGLATAEGTATAATFSLSGALSGLWATLMANPLVLVAAGVSAAVMAISSYSNSMKEAMSSAREAGNSWSEENTSLEDNISRIQELREALASGTLTEQEAADAKSELLSIQESLTDSYGDQVEGIDLVNGSLEQQINLLEKISQKNADNFLNENKKSIDKATKEMEKERHTYLGQFYDNGSEESEAIKKTVKDLQDKYGEEVFQLNKSSDGFTMDLHFNADAAEAEEALNEFMTEISDIEKKYGESDTLDLMSDNAYSGLKSAKDVLGEYQDLYDQAQKAEMISDDALYSADGKEQTAAKWLSDYAKAVKEYNDAVADGDDLKITEAADNFNTLDSSMKTLSKESGMSEYADQIQEVRDQLNDTAIANSKFTKAVKGNDSSTFGKKVAESAKALKDLNLSDTDFKYAFETEGVQEGEDAVNSLIDAALECGVISDTSSEQVSNLVSMLAELGIVSSTSVSAATEAVSGLEKQLEDTKTTLSGINAATSLLDSQSTGKSITIGDFNSDDLADYTSALEYNNGALQLNAEKVRALQKAKAEEAIQTNDNLKQEKQTEYMQNIAEIEQLQEKLRGLSDAKSENAEKIQSNIDALLAENDGIVNQCNQLDLLSASLREATGAYQAWLDKQNASESGDMFDDAMGALQHIEDTVQVTDSEYYGRTGREDYKAAVDFIVPDNIDHEDEAAVSSYIDSIEHYFNHDSDGNRTGLDVAEFCAKATKAGLMELDEASGEYKVAGQRTMQDFADGLNLSLPFVQAMFGEMEEFNAHFDWSDEAIKTLGDLGMAAGEAKGRIEELAGDKDLDIQIDVSDIESTEDKVATLDNTIQQMQDYKGTVEVDSSQVDDANTVIQYCVTQKQMLEAPAVMSVDTSQVEGDLGNALSLLQQFQEAQNNVELQTAVGADTSEAQGKVDGLVSEIQGLSPEIQAQLNIDTTSADTIEASLQALTPEIMVKAGVDSAVVDAWAAEEKKSDGTVKWKNDTGTVDAWAAQMHTSNGTVSWTNDVSQVKTTFTATGTVNWTNTNAPTGGKHGVNGTAHAAGTAHYNHLVGHAYANGNWGTKTGGTTLVGELGREIVVDPGSGTWHTVGDNGAEFVNIPAGSIVFNHLQSEALLERGFVNGRGTARANGSAMVTGGISKKQANIASHKTTYAGSHSSGNTSSGNSGGSGGGKTGGGSSSSSKWTDPWKNVKDWFERVVQKLQSLIDVNKAKADNADAISTKDKYTRDAIANTERLISNYGDARKMYVKKSNAYAKKIGLSAKLKKRVQDGTVDLESLSETDKSKVEAYQKWYDKIVECDKAIQDLKAQEKELYQQRLDNVTTRYDALRSVYENANNMLSSRNEWIAESGKYSQNFGGAYSQNIASQRSNQQSQTSLITKEIEQYKKQLAEIKKKYGVNSTFYREALAGLRELQTALEDSKKATAELTNQLDELAANAAQYKTDKYTRASEKQSAYRDYKDANRYYDASTGDFAEGITEADYQNAITTNNNTINALQEQKNLVQQKMLTLNAGSAEYQEYADQLAELDKKILETANSNAELKKSIVDLRFEQFDEAQDKLDDLIEDYGNLRDMMDSDTFYNDDGSFTDTGLANIALINKEMDAYRQKISDCTAELDLLEELKKNGMITADEYKERSENAMSEIQQASKSLYSDQQSLLDMYENKITKENDLLQENIDKRKKALDNKKDYYEYDKTIKDKTKDINALKAQIAALEGTTNAAAKAKLAKLKADLKDKEEDLADTKYEHQLDMESKGYDDLSEKADDALDNTLKSLKSNTDLQKSVINDMLSEVKDSYKETFGEISKILEEMGYQTSELFKDLMNVNTIKNSTNETVNDAKNHPGDYTNVDTSGVSSDSKANAAISGALKDSESAGNAANGIGYDQNGKSYDTTTGTGNNKKYVNQLSLSLNPKNVTVYEGKEKSVKVSYTNAFSDNLKNFTVTINDSTIATVQKINNSSFKITGKKTGRAVVSVHPVVSSAATVKLAVTVRRNTYGKHAKTVDAAINKSGYGFTAEERQSIKDSLIIGKSESALNNKKDFDSKTQEAIQKKLKEKLTTWYNSLKNKKFKPSDYQKKHALVQHFNQKGKDVPASKFVDVASILGMKYPNAYSKWTSKQKTNLLKKLQSFGFSKGGVVRNLIPADMGTMLGDAIIRNGDTGFIGARPGETVLTEEFTKLLKPSIASMNEFTDMMTGNNGSKLNNIPSVQNQNITFSPEINLNVDRIDSELDIKDLAHQLSGIMYDDFSTKMSKDWKKDMQKLTGRFR